MNQCYTKSQQLASLAMQLLSEQTSQEPRDGSREQILFAFFHACGVEPTLDNAGLFQNYSLAREQLRLIGDVPPERFPPFPDCPAQFSPLLAYAAEGMVVARKSVSGESYTLEEVDEVKYRQGGGSLLRTGSLWFDLDGMPTTQKGTRRTVHEVLVPVNREVWQQLERQVLLKELTGFSSIGYEKGLLYQLPLEMLRALRFLAEEPTVATLQNALPHLLHVCLETSVPDASFELIDLDEGASERMGWLADVLELGGADLARHVHLPLEQIILMIAETACQRKERLGEDWGKWGRLFPGDIFPPQLKPLDGGINHADVP